MQEVECVNSREASCIDTPEQGQTWANLTVLSHFRLQRRSQNFRCGGALYFYLNSYRKINKLLKNLTSLSGGCTYNLPL